MLKPTTPAPPSTLPERFARLADYPGNPLLGPPRGAWLLGDPSILTPELTPDGRWHMFANTVLFIHHYVSDDGLTWRPLQQRMFRGMRANVTAVDGGYLLYHELHLAPWSSIIVLRRSRDLATWSNPVAVLRPELDWEKRGASHMACPKLVRVGDAWRLYYSAGMVWLPDCMFGEPYAIGVAEGPTPSGPFRKLPEPIILPSATMPWRNMGAGAIFPFLGYDVGESSWWAVNNGIYRDARGASRSALMLLKSADGLAWELALPEPFLFPGDTSWREALVYAACVVHTPEHLRVYYNARDGWLRGTERIGVAIEAEQPALKG